MQISNNVAAFNVWKNYTSNVSGLRSSMSKLSSGSRINSAGDDPSGLAMSERLRAQTRNTAAASNNVENKLNYLQTADSWMQKTQDMLGRMGELAVMANDGTKSDTDKAVLQKEFSQMQDEIKRITTGADAAGKFNGLALFDGQARTQQVGADGGQEFTGTDSAFDLTTAATDALTTTLESAGGDAVTKVGTDSYTYDEAGAAWSATDSYSGTVYEADGDAVTWDGSGAWEDGSGNVATDLFADSGATVGLTEPGTPDGTVSYTADSAAGTAATGVTDANVVEAADVTWGNLIDSEGGGVSIDTQAGASDAVGAVNAGVDFISQKRADVGAEMKRMEQTLDGLRSYEENITAAESRIRDVDVAKETSNMSKFQILQQVGTAMLAQANQLPQGVLQLIR